MKVERSSVTLPNVSLESPDVRLRVIARSVASSSLGVEGLGEVVVGAAVKPLHLVVHLRLGGQQQHRNRIPDRAQPPEHGDAVGLRHHNVQHRHVVLARFQIRQGVLTVFHRVDGKEILFSKIFTSARASGRSSSASRMRIFVPLLRDLLFCVYFAPRT